MCDKDVSEKEMKQFEEEYFVMEAPVSNEDEDEWGWGDEEEEKEE